MTAEEAIKTVESSEFSALINVAGSLKTFMRMMTGQPAVEILQKAPGEMIFSRLVNLCETDCDPLYENPVDVAIATYLWIISHNDPDLIEFTTNLVLKCKKCWWAVKLAATLCVENQTAAFLKTKMLISQKIIDDAKWVVTLFDQCNTNDVVTKLGSRGRHLTNAINDLRNSLIPLNTCRTS